MCGIRRVAIAKWLLYWKTRVPRHVYLIRVHGRERCRIHLIHGSLRRDALLDIKCAELIKWVLKHPTIPPGRERGTQAWDQSVGDEVAVVQAIVIQDVMIPPHRGLLGLPCGRNVPGLLNERCLTIAGRLGEALSLMNMRHQEKT